MNMLFKWCGGKSKLLPTLEEYYPDMSQITTYVEPFLGGAANFVNIYNKYPHIRRFILADNNIPLMITYKTIGDITLVNELIDNLYIYQTKYATAEFEEKERLYYTWRDDLNNYLDNWYSVNNQLDIAILSLVMNRLCFNGLWRVNKSNKFNVPFGKLTKVDLVRASTLVKWNELLSDVRVELYRADFNRLASFELDDSCFVYYDPPYKPLNKNSFNQYSSEFGDDRQIRLSDVYRKLDSYGVKQLLSNSYCLDFFNQLYDGFKLHEIKATRSVNSDGNNRGLVSEILVTNY